MLYLLLLCSVQRNSDTEQMLCYLYIYALIAFLHTKHRRYQTELTILCVDAHGTNKRIMISVKTYPHTDSLHFCIHKNSPHQSKRRESVILTIHKTKGTYITNKQTTKGQKL